MPPARVSGLGQPCARGSLCAPGLACDPPGVEPALCHTLPGQGQPCALDESGPFVCADDLGCTEQSTCEALPGLGAPCAMIKRCADGLACDFTAEGSVCVEAKPIGGACQNEVVCGGRAHCEKGMCARDQADGTRCTVRNECLHVCAPTDSGALECAPLRAEGDACIVDDDCPLEMACKPRPDRVRCVPEICAAL